MNRKTKNNKKRGSSWCKKCHSRTANEIAKEFVIRPETELERLRIKVNPTPEEWEAVQEAAKAVGTFLTAKGQGSRHEPAGHYKGRTAWDIIEAATTTVRRFHQLSALTTVLHQVTNAARRPGRGNGHKYTEEFKERVRSLYAKHSMTAIAAMLDCDIKAVFYVIRGGRKGGRRGPLGRRRAPNPNSAVEREAA